MVTVSGPKFRSAKVYPNRKLGFNYNRELPFRKKGVFFRKKGVVFRKRGVMFNNDGVSNIDLQKNERPNTLNLEGIKYYKKGKYRIALKYFERAIAVAPSFEAAKKNRNYCFKLIKEQQKIARAKPARQVSSIQKSQTRRGAGSAVEVHPIDYSHQRYDQLQQYGRIQRSSDGSTGSTEYKDQLGWNIK